MGRGPRVLGPHLGTILDTNGINFEIFGVVFWAWFWQWFRKHFEGQNKHPDELGSMLCYFWCCAVVVKLAMLAMVGNGVGQHFEH